MCIRDRDAIDRTKRMIEFWPDGDSFYTTYEDDGKYIHNQTEEDEKYGTIDHVSYGSHVSTTYTSSVKEGKAILTAECSEGTYEGYEEKRLSLIHIYVTGISRTMYYLKQGETAEEQAAERYFDCISRRAQRIPCLLYTSRCV